MFSLHEAVGSVESVPTAYFPILRNPLRRFFRRDSAVYDMIGINYLNRQNNGNRGTRSHFALHPDFAVMSLNDTVGG